MMFVRLSLVAMLAVAASAPWASVMRAQTDTSGGALFAAIQRGAVGDVERLLRTGANPNAVDADGVPALMAATVFANAEMVEVLLKHGADANQVGPAGRHGADVGRARRGQGPAARWHAAPTSTRGRRRSGRRCSWPPRTRERSTCCGCSSIAAPTSARRIEGARRRCRSPSDPPTSRSFASWSRRGWIRARCRRRRGAWAWLATICRPPTTCSRKRRRRPRISWARRPPGSPPIGSLVGSTSGQT